MKNILYILSVIILLLFVRFYPNYHKMDLRKLIQNGNEAMMEYCNESNLIPTFGLIDLGEYEGEYTLNYFVYTDMNEIHSVVLLADPKGHIREVSSMVDTQSRLLDTLP